jgi:hypothetical protein
MPKYEYHRKDFQPIPTPEEEARDDMLAQHSKGSGRLFALFIVMALSAIFHNEIADGAQWIARLFS